MEPVGSNHCGVLANAHEIEAAKETLRLGNKRITLGLPGDKIFLNWYSINDRDAESNLDINFLC